MKKNIFRIFLAAIIISVVSSMFLAVNAADETEWDLVNYDFSSAPSGVINEGTISDGLLKIEGKKSFYTAPADTTTGKISSEISLRAVSGWVNVYFTNKISAQGYHIQVRNDGDVLLFGGPNNGYIDLIGKYDAKNLCKLTVELDLEEDVFSVSLDGATAKVYIASNVAYYISSNTDARGYSRILVVGQTDDSSAEVDYLKVSNKAVPETPETTETVETTEAPVTDAGTEGANTTVADGTEAPVVTTEAEGTDAADEEKSSSIGLIIGIAAAVVVVAVVVTVIIKKKK